MPPRPSSATIRYRSARTVPGANPPLCGGGELKATGLGTTAFLSGSRVGVSRMDMARPHEEQKRTFSEDATPQPEQVIMRTDCIAPCPRQRSALLPCVTAGQDLYRGAHLVRRPNERRGLCGGSEVESAPGQLRNIELGPMRLTSRPQFTICILSALHYSLPWLGNPTRKNTPLLLRLLPRSKAYSISCSANLLALSPEVPVPRPNQTTYLVQNT